MAKKTMKQVEKSEKSERGHGKEGSRKDIAADKKLMARGGRGKRC